MTPTGVRLKIVRERLEYKEIAREAVARELVSDPDLGRRLLEIAGYRNRLVHHYENVTPEELCQIVSHDLGDLETLADELRRAAERLARRGP